MFSLVDLVIILSVIAITLSYIIVIAYYWKVVNNIIDEEIEQTNKELENRNNRYSNNN